MRDWHRTLPGRAGGEESVKVATGLGSGLGSRLGSSLAVGHGGEQRVSAAPGGASSPPRQNSGFLIRNPELFKKFLNLP